MHIIIGLKSSSNLPYLLKTLAGMLIAYMLMVHRFKTVFVSLMEQFGELPGQTRINEPCTMVTKGIMR
jgi:hypothetical protein